MPCKEAAYSGTRAWSWPEAAKERRTPRIRLPSSPITMLPILAEKQEEGPLHMLCA